MLIFTTNSNLHVYLWVTTLWNTAILPPDTLNFTSQISPVIAQRRPAYELFSFCYVTTRAESEQPVGVPLYQWLGCRDHAGFICYPHSGSWWAQGGPVYMCRHQRKHVFHNISFLQRRLIWCLFCFVLFFGGDRLVVRERLLPTLSFFKYNLKLKGQIKGTHCCGAGLKLS